MRPSLWLCLILAAGLAATGCGGGSSSISISLSQTTATVRLQQSIQFTASVSGSSSTVDWSVNGLAAATSTTPSGNSTVGSVDSTGVYTAPNTLPVAGTTITVTATVSGTSTSANITITLDSGVRVSVTPTSYTIGTGEQFQLTATVTGLASDQAIPGTCVAFAPGTPNPSNLPLCNAVTWSVTGTNAGSIVPTTGVYTAPPAATTASITATSVFDTNQAATVTATISTATAPTITSISPTNVAAGTLFQDLYITGANFLSTTIVYVDNVAVGNSQSQVVSLNSNTTLRVRLLDANLIHLAPGVQHTVTVSQELGSQQSCIVPAQCQLTLFPVRPAIIGAPSVPQSAGAGSVDINVDGGYFGTPTNPAVTVKVGGKAESLAVHDGVSTLNRDRQLTVTINGSDVSTPGLYPLELDSNTTGVSPSIVNLAVQPTFSGAPSQLVSLPVGVNPAAVAINTATGIAVVANQGSNDVTLVDMTQSTPVVLGFICTGVTGPAGTSLSPTETNACPTAGPMAVAVDNVRNMALVANTGTGTVAAIDLTTGKQNVAVLPPALANVTFNQGAPNSVSLVPAAIGINAATGRGLVAFRSTNVGVLVDLTQWTSATPVVNVAGVVSMGNGLKTRIGVSSKLNWAMVTPGQLGSFSIVDLNRQNVATIATSPSGGAVRVAGSVSSTVTITTTAAHALQVGQAVAIGGIADPSFDGYYTVASVPTSNTFTYAQSPSLTAASSGALGGSSTNATTCTTPTTTAPVAGTPATACYATPVASLGTSVTVQGIAVNDETQQVLLVDPLGATSVQVLNLLDQSFTPVTFPTGDVTEESNAVATALNPLADFGLTVNNTTANATLIDPAHQTVLGSPFPVGPSNAHPVDVAIDPTSDEAIFVNTGTNSAVAGTVTVFSLGTLRSAPQILEVGAQANGFVPPPGPAVIDGAAIIIGSSLSAPVSLPPSASVTLTITGGPFVAGNAARLDGSTSAITTTLVNSRQIRVQVPASLLSAPHRYAVDVINSSGAVSNASSFSVIQSVDLTTGNSNCTPQPQGVAVDDNSDLAVVTEPGCNNVALIDLAFGTAVSGKPAPCRSAAVLWSSNATIGGLAVVAQLWQR